jgi:2-phospho-L-lactate/phosphoenolpyruvate guanylyltransferase
VLIVPADLPLLTPADVRAFLQERTSPPMIVISPDRSQQGTNMLFITPADLFTFSFGQDSYATHTAQARAAGARVEVYENEHIAIDLDTKEDYMLLKHKKKLVV